MFEWQTIAGLLFLTAAIVYSTVSSRRDRSEETLKKAHHVEIDTLTRKIDALRANNEQTQKNQNILTRKLRKAQEINLFLLGDILDQLLEIQRCCPTWLPNGENFFLRSPGALNEMRCWATRAEAAWIQIERLSPDSRRIIEEACISRLSQSGTSHDLVQTPLLLEAMAVISTTPRALKIQALQFSSIQFRELAAWIRMLERVSHSYILRILSVDKLREQVKSVFDEV